MPALSASAKSLLPIATAFCYCRARSGVQALTALSTEQKIALLTELDVMTQEVDLVLIDTGSGISDAVTYFTTAAQEIVVVATRGAVLDHRCLRIDQSPDLGSSAKTVLDSRQQRCRRRRGDASVRRRFRARPCGFSTPPSISSAGFRVIRNCCAPSLRRARWSAWLRMRRRVGRSSLWPTNSSIRRSASK